MKILKYSRQHGKQIHHCIRRLLTFQYQMKINSITSYANYADFRDSCKIIYNKYAVYADIHDNIKNNFTNDYADFRDCIQNNFTLTTLTTLS